jgi:P27 family predicted phage terminase small subunit
MGVMGRPPKPTALKKLQGNPGRRPLPKNEPQPELGIPTRPEWLLTEAKREWNRVVPELARLGLLAKVDRALIAAYCQCWARYVEAQQDIAEHGSTFTTDRGYEGPRPSVAIAKQALEKMTVLSAKFGFTPSDRSRLRAPEAEKKDPFEEFLRETGQLKAASE